jgi:hypothetical protein
MKYSDSIKKKKKFLNVKVFLNSTAPTYLTLKTAPSVPQYQHLTL